MVRSACLADVSDRCGKEKENCFPATSKRCASLRDCVQETACVSSLCCVLSEARKKKEKQEKASDPRRKSKSLSRIYVCTTDSGKGKWGGVVPRGESLRTICIKKTEKVKLGETRDIVRDDCARRVLDCDFFFFRGALYYIDSYCTLFWMFIIKKRRYKMLILVCIHACIFFFSLF